jgi:23S rRNA maturation mini-RNase III
MCAAPVVRAFTADANLKRKIRRHFVNLGFTKANDGTLILPDGGKDAVRKVHAGQRSERLAASARFLERSTDKLLGYFANGNEIDPPKIELALIRVETGSEDSELFRLASLTWSVPVSAGFGRRLRYLVWDQHHERLAGIVALGDPVFNLSVRDNLIGWNSVSRGKRLVNVLDAYVLGAVPPYNMLLVGKAIV